MDRGFLDDGCYPTFLDNTCVSRPFSLYRRNSMRDVSGTAEKSPPIAHEIVIRNRRRWDLGFEVSFLSCGSVFADPII